MVVVGKIFRLFTIFCEHLLPLVIRVTRGLRNVDKCQPSQRTYDMNIDYAVLHCLTPATPLFLFVHIFLAERLHIRQLSFVFSLSLDRIPRLAFRTVSQNWKIWVGNNTQWILFFHSFPLISL